MTIISLNRRVQQVYNKCMINSTLIKVTSNDDWRKTSRTYYACKILGILFSLFASPHIDYYKAYVCLPIRQESTFSFLLSQWHLAACTVCFDFKHNNFTNSMLYATTSPKLMANWWLQTYFKRYEYIVLNTQKFM